MTNSKINSNNATNSSGGGVYNNLGNIYVNYWDAANPTQGTNLTVRGETTPSEFNNNTAGRNGGGLNTHRGRIYMRGQTTSKEITISGNTAGNGGNKGSGGGVFCMGDGSDPTAEQIRLFNVNLIGNKAYGKGTTTTGDETVTNGSGGGIYLQYGGINLTKVKMQGNYARQNGGGLNNHNGVINVRGCTIGGDNYYDSGAALEGNKADSCGGGVYTQLGDINITKKWRIGFTTGYDFVQKSLSYTSIDIYRDMHCWEMSFNWIPVGYRKGWSFTINVKSSTLRDVLKYKKERDFRDNL